MNATQVTSRAAVANPELTLRPQSGAGTIRRLLVVGAIAFSAAVLATVLGLGALGRGTTTTVHPLGAPASSGDQRMQVRQLPYHGPASSGDQRMQVRELPFRGK